MADIQQNLFSPEEMRKVEISNLHQHQGPVTCLGMEFENDEARRAYFREELRKKLPELRKIEGFPIGEDDDIINLSDPPYYTACPNPWLNEIESNSSEKMVEKPYSDDLFSDDKDPVYSFHPYHTKVPPTIIQRLIEYYTNKGDIVMDIFSGSGMTGVAAHRAGRNVILSDLSPIATYISANNVTQYDAIRVINAFNSIIDESENVYGKYYTTKQDGKVSSVNYFVWTDVFTCPECIGEIPFFPYGVKHYGNKVETLRSFSCPHCGVNLNVRKVERIITSEGKKRQIAWVNAGTRKEIINREPNPYDIALADEAKFTLKNANHFFPIDAIDPERYSAKLAQLGNKQITDISKFLSDRNLLIFSDLFSRVSAIKDLDVRRACMSILTSIFTVVSERQGYFGGGGGMSGNLYMPIVRMEKNIYATLRRKLKKFNLAEHEKNRYNGCHYVTTQSSTSLSSINTNSIDYIYNDPPFGANIMYSEMNLLLEGWLKIKTNNGSEAIIDESTNKTFNVYSDLITNCFKECYRVLKPSHWMSVEFHNSKASIWNLLQNSIRTAGFDIVQVVKLDKGSTTILADIREGAAVQDLIISCYKPSNELSEKITISGSSTNIWDYMEEHISHLLTDFLKDDVIVPMQERSLKILFDRMVAFFIQRGYSVPMNFQDFQEGMKSRFIERDHMFFVPSQIQKYEAQKKNSSRFAPLGLIVSDEANGIEWLKRELSIPQSYKDIQPKWLLALGGVKKGNLIPELTQILEENFIKDENGLWHIPDLEKQIDLEKIRRKRLMKDFAIYVELTRKPYSQLKKDVSLEALREGFKQCFKDKDFATILLLGDKIPQNILTEDEVLLQYYDIAQMRS